MKDTQTKEKFIELRATGKSYAQIAEDLKVSKPTLITWSRELKTELANARAIRLTELLERFAIAKEKRIEWLGHRLEAILAEADKRDLSGLSTEKLLELALKYGAALRDEHVTPVFQATTTSFDLVDNLTSVESWPA